MVDVARRFFNDANGWSIVERIACNSVERCVRSMYLPLAAFSVLIQYTENFGAFQYQANSVKVVVQGIGGSFVC